MSPVLRTLKTDDINRLNNARSHMDGVFTMDHTFRQTFYKAGPHEDSTDHGYVY